MSTSGAFFPEAKQDEMYFHFDNKNFKNLRNWLKEGDVETSKVQIVSYRENFRGLHAAVDIQKDEQIFFIPKKFMVTMENICLKS